MYLSKDVGVLTRILHRLKAKRSKLEVEEVLESEISAVLTQEGLASRIGLIFPPVDVSLSSPPKVLVISPRDRIKRMKTVLLKPSMNVEDQQLLEETISKNKTWRPWWWTSVVWLPTQL